MAPARRRPLPTEHAAPSAAMPPAARRAPGGTPGSALARMVALVGARAGNQAAATLLAHRRLIEDLPEGPFRKGQLGEDVRKGISESASEFREARQALSHRRELLAGLGFDLPQTNALFQVADRAAALPGYLLGAFSPSKRTALVRDYATVRAAEQRDLMRLARNELDAIYPLEHLPEGRTLNKILKSIFLAARREDEYVSYAFLKKYVDGASPDERKAAGANPRLIELATERLAGRAHLPALMIDLEAFTPGSVEHFRPEKADAIIRERLDDWIPDVVIAGKSIEGKAAVLRGAAWEGVLKKYLVGQPPGIIQDTIDSANAFTAPEGTVFVSGDRGNPGTMIHEGIHFYAPDDFLRAHGEPLNEGVTEYFARKITVALKIERSNYEPNLQAAKTLVERAGEPAVINAYFKADMAGLTGIEIPTVG
jgi:hypothetical protein